MNKTKLTQSEEQKLEKLDQEEKRKNSEENKNRRVDWFQIGSFRRICMVILSYILILSFLFFSFLVTTYSYWFHGETVDSYQDTERFQDKIQSQIKKTVPALEQYLQQDILDSNEMVEIYTLFTEDMGKGKIKNCWKKSKSYTCESGARIAGFSTNFQNSAANPWLYYEKKSDEFILQGFSDTHFIKRWEANYYSRNHDGTQKYCAVSSNTMKEWILKYGEDNEADYYPELPKDVHWLECDYGYNEADITILCYSEKKDRWYYLTGNDEYQMEKKAFRMPNTVYFPLYSVKESNTKEEIFSDGLSKAKLCINNGLLREKLQLMEAIDGQIILEDSPFFNLKTILYEAGKEYYYQKMLISYINSKMNGYLWEFCFHGDSGDTIIAMEDISSYDNIRYENEFFIDYNSEQIEQEGLASILTGIGQEQGYYSLTVSLALPQYSLTTALMNTRGDQEIRYYLEDMVFQLGHETSRAWVGLAILSLIIYCYLLIRLLFGKGIKSRDRENIAENITKTESSLTKEGEIIKKGGKQQTVPLARFDYFPIEISIFICGIVLMGLFLIINDVILRRNWAYSVCIFILFFYGTLAYFLCYIIAASLIRRIRAGILGKNLVITKGSVWVWKKCRDSFIGIWKNSNWKRKTVMMLIGYIIGSIFCSIAAEITSFIFAYDREPIYIFSCIFMIILFIGLQIQAANYVIRNEVGANKILKGIKELSKGNLEYEMDIKGLSGEYLEMAETLPQIRDGLNKAIQKSLRNERMKTELITNVSHDIKTPLTSIINYVDLLKRAKPQGENVEHYLEVLTQKSERLRHLIEDLVEASKASSGTLVLDKKNLNLIELIQQAMGEFEEKLSLRNLQILVNYPKPPVVIFADGQRIFRIIENLFQNVYKYAMEGTRVYLDLEVIIAKTNIESSKETHTKTDDLTRENIGGKKAVMTLRNISAAPLNISEEELTERFVRGEESRTTEGSGLGLSIAKDLVKLQGGEFRLKIDGDLFKVIIEFPTVEIGSDV